MNADHRCAAAIRINGDRCTNTGRSEWDTFGGRRIWICGTHLRSMYHGFYLWNDVQTLVTRRNTRRVAA